MKNNINITEGVGALHELIANASTNIELKKEFISNPESTIEKHFNAKLNIPEKYILVVEDQSDANIIYLNIPKEIDVDDMELSDQELELVSGGTLSAFFTIDCAAVATVICVVAAASVIIESFADGVDLANNCN